jgi:hypothetical protein
MRNATRKAQAEPGIRGWGWGGVGKLDIQRSNGEARQNIIKHINTDVGSTGTLRQGDCLAEQEETDNKLCPIDRSRGKQSFKRGTT